MPPEFRKTDHNHNGGWSRSFFTDVVTVEGPKKLIYISGIGSEDPSAATPQEMVTQAPGDFAEQTRIAYAKIKDILAAHGATFADIVRMTTYVTDAKNVFLYHEVQAQALQGTPPPPHTFLQVAGLAMPEMLVEVEVTAAVADA
ncbi:enamine deaminase RidA (YjgF/YER057c/UK114 family) [Actinoplanes lutulentus]|uniref:Enamine deaminase RidA (YjgF/YER057c/UK114 family) n=1 Tax=Actinoplanes lutulentus TaxID=1287878 RepID=A0A327Z206_9ACTN|nr:RidA family protein [Actinoplanes lutulentus]MBB2943366.1 enamine deaminase RidA (YjgF/YER057c/UK114 family) [Actinoplanes lutulentus]RAK28424.1 enamine deaminase RidA (YjgF/YER057c/UK114 family) [Actinoplanes lutulentus]